MNSDYTPANPFGNKITFTALTVMEKLKMKLGVKSHAYWLNVEYERLIDAHNKGKKLLESSSFNENDKNALREYLKQIWEQIERIQGVSN